MSNFLWGLWNGITAWPLLIIHLFGGWHRFPIYDVLRDGGWYQFGFLVGAGSPIFGLFGRKSAVPRRPYRSFTHHDFGGHDHPRPA